MIIETKKTSQLKIKWTKIVLIANLRNLEPLQRKSLPSVFASPSTSALLWSFEIFD